MRSEAEVREVFRLHALGLSAMSIAQLTAISQTHVRRLLKSDLETILSSPSSIRRPCVVGATCPLVASLRSRSYAYLLGQYLGDGHISHNHRGVYRLEIFCCRSYPEIMDECAESIASVLPSSKVGRRRGTGVVAVGCYSKHLPCLFPQHGPGMKHTRPIVLEPWQGEIALDQEPERFLKGLIHSDGWRGINRVRGANGSRYDYPRYQFSNRSSDIRELFCVACDRVGVEWRQMNRWTISVARRDSVALLDEFIGPKA